MLKHHPLLTNTNKTLLSFSDRSIYFLMAEKMLLLWLNSIVWGEHFIIDFDGQLSEILVTSCLSSTFPVNDIVFFVFCCVQGVAFVAVAALLSLKVIARDAIYLHFFWENGYDTSLKGNGINKKNNYYLYWFSSDFWNSLELSSWILKKTFLSFSFFMG